MNKAVRLSLAERALLGDYSAANGLRHEEMAFAALAELRRGNPCWYYEHRRATEEEDLAGKDLFVQLDIGEVAVNIKSSVDGMVYHHHHYRGQRILCLVVHDFDSAADIRHRFCLVMQEERDRFFKVARR